MATDRSLLAGLIDYAGVFPPARHPLDEAVRRYREARQAPAGWILGPFLCLGSQLPQLDQLLSPDEGITVGVVLDIPPDRLARPVDQIELKVDGADYVAIAKWAPVVYGESPDPADLSFLEGVAAARSAGLDVRAKIRTGGASAESFPSANRVAAFIRACVGRHIPFKATAGLHHPFRHDSDVPDAVEHGFMNLMAATRAALADPAQVVAALEATDSDEFEIATGTWRGIGASVDAATVRRHLRSFGSCSFDEPAGYLRELGALVV